MHPGGLTRPRGVLLHGQNFFLRNKALSLRLQFNTHRYHTLCWINNNTLRRMRKALSQLLLLLPLLSVFSCRQGADTLHTADDYFRQGQALHREHYLLRAADCYRQAACLAGRDSMLHARISLELGRINRFKLQRNKTVYCWPRCGTKKPVRSSHAASTERPKPCCNAPCPSDPKHAKTWHASSWQRGRQTAPWPCCRRKPHRRPAACCGRKPS